MELDINNNIDVVTSLRSGSDSVFDAVYKHYFNRLCSYTSGFIAKDDAIDVVQATMMWLWENRQTLVVELPLKSLLFTIVKNKALDRLSHNQIKDRIHGNIVKKYEAELDNPNLYMENELLELFAKALDKLSDDFRQTFEMSRIEGKTYHAIAKEQNVSVQTVNYRISQALKLLRKELKDYMPLLLLLLDNKTIN